MPRPFLIHSSMPQEASYASYLGNCLFTNFPHTEDSIPTPFTQTPINLSPTSIDLSQNETVPETQPPNDGPSASKPIKKRSHKKKTEADKALETAKRKQLKWTVPDELALARGWFQQSQHATLGNSQHRTHLWQGVSRVFHQELGREVYRENDSLSSKWSDISGQLTKYSGRMWERKWRDLERKEFLKDVQNEERIAERRKKASIPRYKFMKWTPVIDQTPM
ncbi:uncharacterized protein LOC110893181 [Helianthus annuus]|uniref:uncharacterized protein LOC110893181 n=1 Tax=Helianthus annuus TaxID=4232 RepID=UPI001652D96C|nr:uncharacterized protein LOC110893181 [Helianthus annuus]